MKVHALLLSASFTLVMSGCSFEPSEIADIPVIPYPASVTVSEGTFLLDRQTEAVFLSDTSAGGYAAFLDWMDQIRSATGLPLPVRILSDKRPHSNIIRAEVEAGLTASTEGYSLEINEDGIRIRASTAAGLYYALQTIRQLLPAQIGQAQGSPDDAAWKVPLVEISDSPRFSYRGMHLDVGRHFFPVDFVKRYIDLMSRYKMNYFHWHLTEDQGWRIEIKKYPRLTEVGAIRKETILEKNFDPYVGDGIRHGGFYTQEEIRDVVSFAAKRFVTIIPEIEMPGHSTAALAAYPELACTDGPFEVATVWGVKEDIYCPHERTFEFLEDVLTEVIDLFPSPFIHIGGDEVPKRRWEESAVAQDVIRREGLADESELQSWFIRRIERFLTANGKRLIGWDEILEGGLAPDATVMSWRGMSGGIEAAKLGHDVVMTPTHWSYFDYYQGNPETEPLAIGGLTPLDTVYAFEPIPNELTEDEARHVLGAQGNVWTEYMKTPEYVEYMAFPRALALAEVVWSPVRHRDYARFRRRLARHLLHLDILGVNYRIPEPLSTTESAVAMAE